MPTPDWTSEIVEAMAREIVTAQDRAHQIQSFTNQISRDHGIPMPPPAYWIRDVTLAPREQILWEGTSSDECDAALAKLKSVFVAKAALTAALPMILEKAAKVAESTSCGVPLNDHELGGNLRMQRIAAELRALAKPKDN